MFDSHPEMAIPPEFHMAQFLAKVSGRSFRRAGFGVDAFVEQLTRHYGFRRTGLQPDLVRARLREEGTDTVADAVRLVFSLYAAGQGKRRYAEKTPVNVVHMPTLARVFPEARFIHLIRDGRDVALSYLDADFGVNSVAESAIYWQRFVKIGRRDGRRLGPERYREIRYEDLVEDPESSLRSLCDFVALPFDRGMLSYHRRADDLMVNLSHRQYHQRLHLPPTRGLRDWRRDMRSEDVLLFEALAGKTLAELGYQRHGSSIPVGTRVQAFGARSSLLAHRVVRRSRKGRRGLVQPGRRPEGNEIEGSPPQDRQTQTRGAR
jgi:hypothetical protein